ncbi:hypothetical protein CA54_31860 [Symmachiella macrocystis]|uniref:Uncharacterized protein n=1 Tax=Symmachiella macrocystis TaxID=2527985 RepID=A0A5C6BSD3_9PLAN|nr:hypothetical protein [Symmachiella macrocystis]TWU14341.1 hypothetical protein CA54_31860 [Symmachiella macrocystis]
MNDIDLGCLMETAKPKDNALLEHLELLERSLHVPLVPGELGRWLEAVQTELDSTERVLHTWIESKHAKQFQQIGSEDPALFGRVREMKHTDQENLQRCAILLTRLAKLKPLADAVGADEKQLEEPIENIVQHGLEFVTEVRKQETVIDTWLMEAYDRDRGFGH